MREPVDGGTAQLLVGRFDPFSPPEVDPLLEATHAVTGGLPPGLEVGTTGPDSWRAMPVVCAVIAERVSSSDATVKQCLDALALGRDLARGGGIVGISAAWQLSRAVFEPCGRLLVSADPETQAQSMEALSRVVDGAPTLARAFREADLDAQVHLFGTWMRPQDVAALSPSIRAGAAEARTLPSGFFARQQLLGVWSKMSKTTHAAMDALELPAAERDRTLEQLEASVATPSLGFQPGWRAAMAQHEDRLTLLRMLRLAVQLSMTQTKTSRWPALSEVEAGDFMLTTTDAAAPRTGAGATLKTRSTSAQLMLSVPWRVWP